MERHKRKQHYNEYTSSKYHKSSSKDHIYQDKHENIRKQQNINESSCKEYDVDDDKRDERTKPSASKRIYLNTTNPDFPWTEYRSTLNKIFFNDKGKIKRNTSEYDEFWIFLKKYQLVQQKAAAKKLQGDAGPSAKSKIDFSLDSDELENMMIRGHLFRDDDESALSRDHLLEFAYIIQLYLNCLKKQQETKLKKLREAQENLPISKYRNEILRAVESHQVVLVAGDTGCGKSTQVPQYLLAAGYDSIACTQPRRIACISLCKRVAYETQNEYASEIGYQIRFEKSKTSHTKILFLTEGLLLRQVSSDPMLSMYKVVILDEVHERHLSCDFLLGIMKCLTIQRPDLKILLMSATINIELFTEYFNNCPVIQVPGRLFPIQVKYCPVPSEEMKTLTGKLNPSPYIRVLNLIDQKYPKDERGDVLIFLSGMTEISIVEEAARAYGDKSNKWIILPLHSTLSIEEQDKVFDIAPEGVRKCIISTNVAETSVTIDGVRFVVDSGKVKEMSYHPVCHMQRLQEFWVSKASAEQRKGRAGRTGPGACFRLYSQQEYDSLEAYAKPEIQRVPLDSLLLQLLSMGLPNARKFPFLEPPEASSIEESLQNLKSQGALTEDEELTPMGQMLSKLPVDVTIGKMLIHGCVFSVIEPMLSLAAALSVQSPFTNRSMRDPEMRDARQSLESDHGDPFTLLTTYHKWLEVKAERQNSRKWCKRRGLEEQRFYEMTKLRRQFKELLKDSGLLPEDYVHTSSHQRSSRHGELSHLRDMKRQFHQAPHKRKVLKLDSEYFQNENDDSDDGRIDIHDIDFWISNNSWQVQLLSSKSQVSTYRDMVCLKFIVCSALYPRIAIADIHNSYKSSSDQHFHTKGKPFVVLHPNGTLALQPEFLQLKETEIVELKNVRTVTPLSKKHQIVCFLSLLETTKPFLVNCLRVPAAHILLLCSHSLDTNQDFTKIVCDGWIELRFPESENIQDFVYQAFNIRDSWQKLLQKAFEEFTMDKEAKNEELRKMGKRIYELISQFFHSEIIHSVRRLLAADVKNLYTGPQGGDVPVAVGLLDEAQTAQENKIKGGLQIKPYLTYNCLVDLEDKYLQYVQKHWTCPSCGKEMVATVLDQIRHKETCVAQNETIADTSEEPNKGPPKKSYFCPTCQEELQLTLPEILRHKRSHTSSS
ncbi:putative ATP-dependent RNA helicase DHX34 [Araneus ventricosus]|uniref:Putative ATP-dependent RNA helicase DHX34 n=1 Tax=Araneus ventricosus TaxID=182803 RepID=A0A4Y2BLW3_ARAVE|nr:putative ATP-dependent RNA helicase DHX34 [Araneus ventricosus]